MKTIML